MPNRILIDALGAQAKVHLTWKRAQGLRLETFLQILERLPADVDFLSGQVTPEKLAAADVFIDTTRKTRLEDLEVDALVDFVHEGGGLLIMSNHGPGRCQGARVAERFGITLRGDYYTTLGGLTDITATDFLSHPLLDGVSHLVTNTTDAILADPSCAVARLPASMSDRETGDPPRGHLFAAALDADPSTNRRGRLVTLADSGFIGNPETRVPGPGLIDRADNARFITNILTWLTHPA